MITIIDYEVGNVAAIKNMLKKSGYQSVLTRDHEMIRNSSKIVLPGIGAFDSCARNLDVFDLRGILNECALEKNIPTLGICVGMQLLASGSEEGNLPGLNWVEGYVRKFNFENTQNSHLKIPHMGWNTIRPNETNPLFKGLEQDARFYFAHSYHFECKNAVNEGSLTNYGYDYPSSVHSGNIYGVQFHPEKSHRFGIKILTNFANLITTKI